MIVVQGVPSAGPYMIPSQALLYPHGVPPTYDQALAHPGLVGQPVSSKLFRSKFMNSLNMRLLHLQLYPGTSMYAAGYPTYLGHPTYAPMQYYPSLGAYSYTMQPTQLRPTIMIPVSLAYEGEGWECTKNKNCNPTCVSVRHYFFSPPSI